MSTAEAVVNAFRHARVGDDIEEVSFNHVRRDADGVGHHLCAELVILRYHLEDFAVVSRHTVIGILHVVDHFGGDELLLAEMSRHGVGHGVHAHAADADIAAGNGASEGIFQFLLDAVNARRHLVEIVDTPLADERFRRVLCVCEDFDGTVRLFLPSNSRHLGRTEFYCYDEVVICHIHRVLLGVGL